jgi:hypothetical protein
MPSGLPDRICPFTSPHLTAGHAGLGFNTLVLSNCAGSSDWIECLIDPQSPPHLLERSVNIWFAQRLADRMLVKWALGAQPGIKAIVARAVQPHLAVPRVLLPDVMCRFWRLYLTAFGPENRFNGFDRPASLSGLNAGATDYFTIESVVEIVRPRLQLTAPSQFLGSDDDSSEASDPAFASCATETLNAKSGRRGEKSLHAGRRTPLRNPAC